MARPARSVRADKAPDLRWLHGLGLALLSVAVIVPLVLYWQESPLRAARKSADSKEYREAFARVNYFLHSHPRHSEALALKACLLVEIGQVNEAIELFDEVGTASAQDMHAKARAYIITGRFSRALGLLAQVAELEPDNVDAIYELAAIRIRLGLLDDALPVAEKLAKFPGYEARALVFVGAIQRDQGNYAKAAVAYDRALKLAPTASGLQIPADEFLLQYGSVLNNLGQTDKAIEMLQRSVAARPTASAYTILGNSLSQLGRVAEAQQAWATALELDPANRHARESLANAALQEGDVEAAQKWLKPLEYGDDLRASTAYLFQRVHHLLNDPAGVERWKKAAARLREEEQVQSQINDVQTRSPRSFWANVLRAYKFAEAGNWLQAQDMMKVLAPDAPDDEFVQDLYDAVQRRGELPSLDRLPTKPR